MDFVVLVAALSTSLILVASGAEHVVAQSRLRSSLRAHGVFGPRGAGPAGVVLPVLELGTSIGALGAILAAQGNGLIASMALEAVLFGGFSAYLLMVMRAGKAGVPCACGLAEVPVGRAAIVRAAALALVSAAAALGAAMAAGPITLRGNADALVAGLAGLTFAVLLVILPSTRIDHQTIGSA